MRYFKILHTSAGTFTQGQVVTEDQVRKGGFDLDGWLKLNPPAVEQVSDPDDKPVVQQQPPAQVQQSAAKAAPAQAPAPAADKTAVEPLPAK